jgi:hypothetical protein
MRSIALAPAAGNLDALQAMAVFLLHLDNAINLGIDPAQQAECEAVGLIGHFGALAQDHRHSLPCDRPKVDMPPFGELQPFRNVGRFVEYANNGKPGFRGVGEPISAGLQPKPPRTCEMAVRGRRWKPGIGVALDLVAGSDERGPKVSQSFVMLFCGAMPFKVV